MTLISPPPGVRRTRRVLGVDAGGTGTRAVLVEGGQVVARREIGPMNILLHSDSATRLAALIAETGADAAGLGLAGVQCTADAERVVSTLKELTDVPVAITDDSEAALFGAFDGAPGIVVIAGTGSIACGRDEAGRVMRVGGHGYLLGDDGGGYWIGRECLRAALRAHDGTGPATALTEVVQSVYGHDLQEAIRLIHASPTDRTLLTALVRPAASIDDMVADDIFRRAAGQLTQLARALRARLGALPVAMIGGIFRIDAVRESFTGATDAVRPLGPPELGAVRYAELMLPESVARP